MVEVACSAGLRHASTDLRVPSREPSIVSFGSSPARALAITLTLCFGLALPLRSADFLTAAPRTASSLSPLQRASSPEASDDRIRVWDTNDGLPDHTVTSMVQSRKGHLWLGTFGGLVRFDGFEFTVFTPSNLPELPSVEVVNLHLEGSGRLWVSTTAGLVSREDTRWTSHRPADGWTGNIVRTFSERADTVCLTSFDGQVGVARAGKVTMLPPPPGQPGAGYFGHVDPRGRIWVAQDRYCGHWDGTQWVKSPLASEVTNRFAAAGSARDGSLLIVQDNRILRLADDRVVARTTIDPPVKDVWRVDEDSQGRLWVATMNGGLVRLLPSGQTTRYGMGAGLPADAVRFAVEDREQGIWVGTAGGGLVSLTPRRFRYYDLEHGLAERNIRAVTEDSQGRILVGTYGRGPHGITPTRVGPLMPPGDPLSVAYVEALLTDPSGAVWVGTYGRGLHVLTAEGRRQIPPTESGGNDISALFLDSRGRIWIGGNSNIVRFENQRFQPIGTTEPGGFRPEKIRGFAENAADGSIWAIRPGQVGRFADGIWTEIQGPNGDSLGDRLCLRADPDGSIWMGGDSSELMRWFRGQWSVISGFDGGSLSGIHGILDDGRGHWWLAGRGGVVRVPREDLDVAARDPVYRMRSLFLGRSDGLPASHCGGGPNAGVWKDRSGRLWFATVQGLAVIDPQRLELSTHTPEIRVEQIAYQDANDHLTTLEWDGRSEVIVPAGARRLTVKWTAIALTAPEKLRFAYRVGEEQPWLEVGTRRQLELHIAAPTRLVLQIQAVNGDGLRTRDPATVAVRIMPFLWQTLEARVGGFVGLLVTSTWAAWWWVGARQRQRIRQLESEAALKDQLARDMVIRKRTEEALRVSEERFRTTMQHSPVGMAIVGLDGRWIEINAALSTMFGYTREQLLTLDVGALEHPDDRDMTAQLLRRIFTHEIPSFELERRFVHRDGHTLWAHQSVAVVWNSDGSPRHFIWHVNDVTERVMATRRREELESQLREAQKLEAVGILAGGIAHDFNNILATIVSFAELTQMEHPDNKLLQENQDHILRAARRATSLVRQILSFSRAEKPERACISLAPVVAEAVQLLRSTLPTSIDLQPAIQSSLPLVMADSAQIRQVVLNLVTNAAQALEGALGSIQIRLDAHSVLPESAEVRVDLPPGDYVRLQVVDHGQGMSEETLRHVFEPFFTTKAPGVGSGLGLSVVHGIVQEHRGCVVADSQPGRGSTFSVFLPVATAADTDPTPNSEPFPLGNGQRVLFLDDEAALGEASLRLLEKLGYHADAFRDPARAWQTFQLEPERFDVVICDLAMPRMTGIDFARNLRALRPDIPILLATGHARSVPMSTIAALGIVEVLPKPLEGRSLALALHRALGARTPSPQPTPNPAAQPPQ